MMPAGTPTRHAISAVLFDFDGTLWDSESPIFATYQEVFHTFGQRLAPELWHTFMGTVGFDAWTPLEGLTGRPIDRRAADLQVRRRTDERLSRTAARPGVKRFLADADALGLRRAIVSNSSRPRIEKYTRQCGLGDGWHAVEAADGDISRAKPRADLYHAALAGLGVVAGEAIAFEDSICGISAAKSAGLRCVAVPNPVTDRAALALVAADLVLDSFEQLTLGDVLVALSRDDAVPRGLSFDGGSPGGQNGAHERRGVA